MEKFLTYSGVLIQRFSLKNLEIVRYRTIGHGHDLIDLSPKIYMTLVCGMLTSGVIGSFSVI